MEIFVNVFAGFSAIFLAGAITFLVYRLGEILNPWEFGNKYLDCALNALFGFSTMLTILFFLNIVGTILRNL